QREMMSTMALPTVSTSNFVIGPIRFAQGVRIFRKVLNISGGKKSPNRKYAVLHEERKRVICL
ncbi:hypothetical protein, partial [Pseudomonas aeruginosa]